MTTAQRAFSGEADKQAMAALAAFCICWLHQDSAGVLHGQVEPLGVHQDWRQAGLGRAILSAGLRQRQRHGVQAVYVETAAYRDAALALYESAGFHVIQDVLVYRKDYEGGR